MSTQLEQSIQNKVDELNMRRLVLESDLRIVNAELDYFKNIRYSDLKEAE